MPAEETYRFSNIQNFQHTGCLNVRLKFSVNHVYHNRHFLYSNAHYQFQQEKLFRFRVEFTRKMRKPHNLKWPLRV